jgi:hypothetical protein
MNKSKKYFNNENGQALLFIIVALTVAMAIGMSVSTRTISSVRRSTSTDTSSRVYSAAEGGIEWFLRQPQTVLNNLSDGNNSGGSECPTGTVDYLDDNNSCVINYTAATGDNIESRAVVNVAPFTFNNPTGSTNHYWFYLNSGEVKEVRLNGSYTGNIRICWSSQDTTLIPDLYYSYYNNASGMLQKGILRNRAGTNAANEGTLPANLVINASNTIYPALDFTECALVSIPNNAVMGLRLKSMYAPAKVGVFEAGGTLPTQGYIINSTGELVNEETIRTVKKLKVFRSFQYLPSIFDYAIYSDTNLGITP